MWVRMVRAVVAGRAPRAVGQVVELPESEAKLLVLTGCAVESAAPPDPLAADPVETTDDPLAGVERAVAWKRKGK